MRRDKSINSSQSVLALLIKEIATHIALQNIKESREEELSQRFLSGATGLIDHIEDWVRRVLSALASKGSLSSSDQTAASIEQHIESAIEEDDALSSVFSEGDYIIDASEPIGKQLLNDIVGYLMIAIRKAHIAGRDARSGNSDKSITREEWAAIKFNHARWDFTWSVTIPPHVLTKLHANMDNLANVIVRHMMTRFDNLNIWDDDLTSSGSGKNSMYSVKGLESSAFYHLTELMFADLYESCRQGSTVPKWCSKNVKEYAVQDHLVDPELRDTKNPSVDSEFTTVVDHAINTIRRSIMGRCRGDILLMFHKQGSYEEEHYLWTLSDDYGIITEKEAAAYLDGRSNYSAARDKEISNELHEKLRLRIMPSKEYIKNFVKQIYIPVQWSDFA